MFLRRSRVNIKDLGRCSHLNQEVFKCPECGLDICTTCRAGHRLLVHRVTLKDITIIRNG